MWSCTTTPNFGEAAKASNSAAKPERTPALSGLAVWPGRFQRGSVDGECRFFSENFHQSVPARVAFVVSNLCLIALRVRIDAREVHPLATTAKRPAKEVRVRLGD